MMESSESAFPIQKNTKRHKKKWIIIIAAGVAIALTLSWRFLPSLVFDVISKRVAVVIDENGFGPYYPERTIFWDNGWSVYTDNRAFKIRLKKFSHSETQALRGALQNLDLDEIKKGPCDIAGVLHIPTTTIHILEENRVVRLNPSDTLCYGDQEPLLTIFLMDQSQFDEE